MERKGKDKTEREERKREAGIGMTTKRSRK